MNRNVESRFALNPTNIDISRSTFDRSFSNKTTFNVGQLIPFYYDDVLPGDTFNVKTARVVRLQTLLTPMMDNLYLDTYYFFVPNRLVWDHWKEFMGENTESAWVPETEYSIPQIVFDSVDDGIGVEPGTLADYFGIPVDDGSGNTENLSAMSLPFRAYALIVNEWFRDENLQDPVQISKGDATSYRSDRTGSYVTDLELGGMPFVVSKYRDYFSSALPAPQKGPDVQIPVAEIGNMPVVPVGTHGNSDYISDPYTAKFIGTGDLNQHTSLSFSSAGVQDANRGGTWGAGDQLPIIDNLYALGANTVTAVTINQLRIAFQVQKFFEKSARGGSRYTELLRAHFGVTSPDARLQRPEYLGGNRVPLQINQVIQQSESSASSPMGNVAGMSLTTDNHHDFIKSFTEHGMIIGVCCARYDHTYQQGLARHWSRKTRFDYYFPVFANIGEQAILNKEIYYDGLDGKNDEVFGYNEAFADYRYKPNMVTGEMRSMVSNSLDVWHLADDYASRPYLSADWIQEDGTTVDRVLAVSSKVSDQLFMDVYVKNKVTRPMPLYSIPGLVDHH